MKTKLSAFFLAMLAAASHGSPAVPGSFHIVTSFYPLYVAALNVADGVEGTSVHNLAGPHIGCLHDYHLTAGDARRLADADLLLVNGAGMESFLGKIPAQNPSLQVVEVSEGIPLLDGNPHVWVSPSGARRQAENIAAALSVADPVHARRYAANAAAYGAKLSALDAGLKSALAPYAGTPVVSQHGAFRYFAKDYGLELAGVIDRGSGNGPGPGELAGTVDLVRAKKVKVIVADPQYSDRAARTVARETGAAVCPFDSAVTGPSEPAAARDAYLRAMEKNLAMLQQVLRL